MDAEIELMWTQWQKYGKKLRIVRFYDIKGDRDFEYITNNFELSAEQIANIYRYRWEIEVFFRWIKQNLKIKTFLGTSENAVKKPNMDSDDLLSACEIHGGEREIMSKAAIKAYKNYFWKVLLSIGIKWITGVM